MPYGNLQRSGSNVWRKSYIVIVSKQKGDVDSMPYSLKILPAIFSNETAVLSFNLQNSEYCSTGWNISGKMQMAAF